MKLEKANTQYVTNERVDEIERETNHDIASMVKALAEVCDGDAGEYVHFGATSNDIIDSSQSMLLKDSIEIIQRRQNTWPGSSLNWQMKIRKQFALAEPMASTPSPLLMG